MIKIINHPLANYDLSIIRAQTTCKKEFRASIERLTSYLFIEASENIPVEHYKVKTPMEETDGQKIDQDKISLIPILRAGFWMVSPIVFFTPSVKVYPIGIKRDENNLKPNVYYSYLPETLKNEIVFILDPMLATGGSIEVSILQILKKNPEKIIILSIIAAPEGCEKIKKIDKNIKIYTISLDRELNNNGYILPGLGDAGDRLFS